VTEVVGAVGRTGDMAGTVAALFAEACTTGSLPTGLTVAGSEHVPTAWLLAGAADAGVLLQEYTGIARVAHT
jgi:hypothetical protein